MRSALYQAWRLIGVVLFCGALLMAASRPTHAASFSTLLVRPDRLAAGTSPGRILIQAAVSEAATEDSAQIALGSAWSGSALASAYTVSTSNLPDGVVAWPGIGTATDVTGQAITFPSGDLTPGVTYGFFLTGGILNNPSTPGESYPYIWQVATLVGGSPSSTADAAIQIMANDQITITGSILPPVSDYSVELQATDGVSTAAQNTTIAYTIQYGSSYDFATPLTLQAEWPLGTLEGSITPTVEYMTYVPGSASNAYSDVAPVIDLNARTITWSIPSFPANTTNQTVSFQLQTTATYTGPSSVTGQIAARIINPVATPDSQVGLTYQYAAASSGGDDDGEDDQDAESGEQSTPLTVAPTSVGFVRYQLIAIEETSATFQVTLTAPDVLIARYGTNPNQLNQQTTSRATNVHTMALNSLLPDTIYYVRFVLTDGTESELLQFKTASTSSIPVNSVQLSSDGLFYWSGGPSVEGSPLFPKGWPLEITLLLESDEHTDNIVIFSGNPSVKLEYVTSLTRTQAGVWSGRIPAVQGGGVLPFWARITTNTGSITQVQLFNLTVANQLRVLDQDTQEPIERARIEMYTLDPITKLYTWLAAPEFLLQNPVYTSSSGLLPIALPPGKYRLEVSALGYKSQRVEFSVVTDDVFPTVYLARHGNILLGSIPYHVETIRLKLTQYLEIFKADSQSPAVLQLATWWTLLFSTPLTVAFLLAYSRFSLLNMLRNSFLGRKFMGGKGQWGAQFLVGRVRMENTKNPPSYTTVTVQDLEGKTQEVIDLAANGRFSIPKKHIQNGGKLIFYAKDYAPKKVDVGPTENQLDIQLSPEGDFSPKHLLASFMKQSAVHIFLLNLLVSVGLGLVYVMLFASPMALPFAILSVINLGTFLVTIS